MRNLFLIAAALALIAPGTAVAGVTVGGMTPGSAAAAITQRHLLVARP